MIEGDPTISGEPADVRVYVNERGVSVARGATALDAVHAIFPEQATAVLAGAARLTDSRGLPADPDMVATGGMILRVLQVRASLEAPE